MSHVVLVQLEIVWENKPANFDRVRLLLAAHPPAPGSLIVLAEMFATALNEGMRTLKQDGMEKVLLGLTDMHQVRAVCIK